VSGFTSPDVPAYISYLIVLVFGALVARTRVSSLLQAYEDRWAFVGTWLVFFAYVVIPVALFWFLDYTDAIHDTSIFAALVVAVGYQQVFAGGIQGITMPGQSTALWKPFEAWVRQVADRIETLNKRYLDRFDEQVRASIASKPDRITILQQLVNDRTRDPAVLGQAVAAAKTDRQKVDILWRDLRSSQPEQYGLIAKRAKLVSPWLYFRWQQKGQGKLMTAAVILAVVSVALYGWSRLDEPGIWRTFHKWRLFKSNVTDRDRFRTRAFYVDLLRPGDANATAVLASLTPELSYSALSTRQADDVLRLVIDCHSSSTDAATLNLLVDALRTANPDVRARVQATMVHLASASFADRPLEEPLKTWAPSKDDSLAAIDTRVAAWRRWLAH
jgi:hypothetical protein